MLGSKEQIFGSNEQILVRADPQRPKNNSRVLHEWSGTFIRAAGMKFVFTLRTQPR